VKHDEVEAGSAAYMGLNPTGRPIAGSAEAVLAELFDLLEEYSPCWYTEAHRACALAVLSAPPMADRPQ
jgi:hypothetical protein